METRRPRRRFVLETRQHVRFPIVAQRNNTLHLSIATHLDWATETSVYEPRNQSSTHLILPVMETSHLLVSAEQLERLWSLCEKTDELHCRLSSCRRCTDQVNHDMLRERDASEAAGRRRLNTQLTRQARKWPETPEAQLLLSVSINDIYWCLHIDSDIQG